MSNISLILFVACAAINSIYNAERTDVGHLNTKVRKLNRKTDFLQKEVDDIWKEVDDIWAEVSDPGTVTHIYNNRTRTDDLGNTNSQNLKTKTHETVNTAQDLKTEVEQLMLTSRNGFKNEKQWQRETVRNLSQMFEDLDIDMTKKNQGVKQQIERLDAELVRIDESCNIKLQNIETVLNERLGERGRELDQVNKILVELKANQHKLETENQVLGQTIIEMQTELTKKQAALLCEEGWRSFNGHCYLVVIEGKAWDDASANCENMNSRLAEITTDAELEFVNELARDNSKYAFWIGATDRDTTGIFVFQHSKRKVPDTYWRRGQPHNNYGDEHCVVLGRYFGDYLESFDERCIRKYGSVCEKP